MTMSSAEMQLVRRLCTFVFGLAMLLLLSTIARADDVTDWNQHMLRAGTVGGTSRLDLPYLFHS